MGVISSEASPPEAGKVWFLEGGLPCFSFNRRAHAKKPCLIRAPLSDMLSGATCRGMERLEVPKPQKAARSMGGRAYQPARGG
jgi:hypothetical protein